MEPGLLDVGLILVELTISKFKRESEVRTQN